MVHADHSDWRNKPYCHISRVMCWLAWRVRSRCWLSSPCLPLWRWCRSRSPSHWAELKHNEKVVSQAPGIIWLIWCVQRSPIVPKCWRTTSQIIKLMTDPFHPKLCDSNNAPKSISTKKTPLSTTIIKVALLMFANKWCSFLVHKVTLKPKRN